MGPRLFRGNLGEGEIFEFGIIWPDILSPCIDIIRNQPKVGKYTIH